MVLKKGVELIIMDMLGCDEQEACDIWHGSKVGKLVDRYIEKKIQNKYGKDMTFSSATGEVELNFEVDGIVDYEKDIYYDLEGNKV